MKIVLSTVVALFLLGCGESKSTSHEVKNELTPKSEVVEKVAVVEEKVAPKEEKVVVAEEKIAPTETKEVIVKEVVPEAQAIASNTETNNVDGAKLFVACAGCHGANGEKKALGKSKVITGWEASKVVTALKGYKDGTYGGAMKAVMKGQASKLSDAEIDALAKYISTLK